MFQKNRKKLLIYSDKSFYKDVFLSKPCAGHSLVSCWKQVSSLQQRSWPTTPNPTSWLQTAGSLANWFDVFPSFDSAVLLLKMNDELFFSSLNFFGRFFCCCCCFIFYLACALGVYEVDRFFSAFIAAFSLAISLLKLMELSPIRKLLSFWFGIDSFSRCLTMPDLMLSVNLDPPDQDKQSASLMFCHTDLKEYF